MQQQQAIASDPHPWLDAMLSKYGTREIKGSQHHKDIIAFLESTTLPADMLTDETAWCSATVNWRMEQAGYRGTRRANARSWLGWGQPLDRPRVGCVTVLWRGKRDASTGHVGLYIAGTAGRCWLLGGNQNNQLQILPFDFERVLGHRWPTAAELKPHVP